MWGANLMRTARCAQSHRQPTEHKRHTSELIKNEGRWVTTAGDHVLTAKKQESEATVGTGSNRTGKDLKINK